MINIPKKLILLLNIYIYIKGITIIYFLYIPPLLANQLINVVNHAMQEQSPYWQHTYNMALEAVVGRSMAGCIDGL